MRFTKLVFAMVLLLAATTATHAQSSTPASAANEQLTIERIFSAPNLTTAAPQAIQFAPSGLHVSYLAGSATQPNVQDLWLYNVRENSHQRLVAANNLMPNTSQLSAEEKARRERLRIAASGIVNYQWSPTSEKLLFPLNGQLFLFDIASAEVTQLTDDNVFATDSRFSPQGNFVSYVHDYNLYVVDLKTATTTQLTQRQNTTEQFATAEFVAQEEMTRMTGYWWSPNENHIALTRVNLSPVDIKQRVDV